METFSIIMSAIGPISHKSEQLKLRLNISKPESPNLIN